MRIQERMPNRSCHNNPAGGAMAANMTTIHDEDDLAQQLDLATGWHTRYCSDHFRDSSFQTKNDIINMVSNKNA